MCVFFSEHSVQHAVQQSNNNTDSANTLTTASYNTSTVFTAVQCQYIAHGGYQLSVIACDVVVCRELGTDEGPVSCTA